MKDSILKCTIAAAMMLCLWAQVVIAQEDNEEVTEETVTAVVGKTITGLVSGISKDYIGVIYQDKKNIEYEMGIYIKDASELERVKDFSEIQAGDTVTVQYDEVSTIGEDGQETSRHVAQKIIFVKKAPPPAKESDTLVSDGGEGQ